MNYIIESDKKYLDLILYREDLGHKKPIAIDTDNKMGCARLLRILAREAMEQAFQFEHIDDFCIPDFTIEEMQKQLKKIIQETT